jgi:hypothetical protein
LPGHNTEVLGSVQWSPTIDTGIQVAEFDADFKKGYLKNVEGMRTIAFCMETMKKFLHSYAYNFFGNFSKVFEKQRRFFVILGASLRIYIINMRPISYCTVYNLE